MTKPSKDTAILFGSLRPESVDDQESLRISAREATLRWPMLRSLLPISATPPAPLTLQEKECWAPGTANETVVHKRALSLPNAGPNLEQSLAKMALQAAAMTAKPNGKDQVADGTALAMRHDRTAKSPKKVRSQ